MAEQPDPAYRILENAPIELELKSDCWDEFYEATSARNLASRLERYDIPDSVKAALVAARKSLEPTARDRIVDAMRQLSQLDPKLLELAEQHPKVLRYLIEAADREAEHDDETGAETD